MGNQEVVMFNRIIFSKRIKQLRKCYKFTIIDFSTCFKIVSKTSVGAWEKATAIPSADVLADLSTFFGISMDWFAGFSNIPYTNESIENAENYMFDKLKKADRASIYLSTLPKEYLDIQMRNELYSLPVRANILVLMHWIYIPRFEKYYENIQKYSNNDTIFSSIKNGINEIIDYFFPPVYGVPSEKKRTNTLNLFHLLHRKITTPIYDIESSDLK